MKKVFVISAFCFMLPPSLTFASANNSTLYTLPDDKKTSDPLPYNEEERKPYFCETPSQPGCSGMWNEKSQQGPSEEARRREEKRRDAHRS